MSSALPSKPQLGVDILLIPPPQKPPWEQSRTGPRGQAWHGQHQTSPAHSPGQGLCAVTVIPSLLGYSWAAKHPSPGGSADSGNSHFRRLVLSPALCPQAHHAADITRGPFFTSSRSAWGPPGRICPHLCRQLLICQEPRRHRQEPLFKNLCRQHWAGHRSGTTFHVLSTPPSQKSHGQAVLCPRDSALSGACLAPRPSAPCPTARQCCPPPQFPHLQSTGLSDAGGSASSGAGLGAALPDGISRCRAHLGSQTCAARGQQAWIVPTSPSPHPLGPSAVLLPRWDLTLPIWGRPLCCCCQGTCTGTHSSATPRWLSQLVMVRGGGDDIPAPAKTNTAPSKHAGLGRPVPRPSITEPAALQPTTAWPGSGAGENQQGAGGGSRHPPPPPLRCWLKDGALSFIPFLGLGTCPGLPAPTRCCYGVLSDARGVGPQPLGTQRVPRVGTAHPQGGCAEGRVPCGCWLGPRRKVGQSHLQALTIINPAPASICHWGWSSKGPDIPDICRRERGRQRAIGEVLGGLGRTRPLHSVLGQWQQSVGQPFQRARFSLEGQILLLPHIPCSRSWAGSCLGLHTKPASLRAVACG